MGYDTWKTTESENTATESEIEAAREAAGLLDDLQLALRKLPALSREYRKPLVNLGLELENVICGE